MQSLCEIQNGFTRRDVTTVLIIGVARRNGLCLNATERNEIFDGRLGGAKLSNRFASMHKNTHLHKHK